MRQTTLINPFVKGLVSGKATATQAHPKNENIIVFLRWGPSSQFASRRRVVGYYQSDPTLREDGVIEEQDHEGEEAPNPSLGQRHV